MSIYDSYICGEEGKDLTIWAPRLINTLFVTSSAYTID